MAFSGGILLLTLALLLPFDGLTNSLQAQQFMSTANVFGGQDFSDGHRTMPNVFGGYSIYSPSGGAPIIGIPNPFGGLNFSNGVHSTRNVFGGQNIYTPSGGFLSTTPNVFGGSNFSSGGYSTPNLLGGFNYYF